MRRFFTSSYSLLFLGPLVALAALSETETTIPVPSHVSLLLRLPLSCAVVSSHPSSRNTCSAIIFVTSFSPGTVAFTG